MDRVCVVIPAHNDWESAQCLLVDLAAVGREHELTYQVILVDDASTVSAPEAWHGLADSPVKGLKIVKLACNLGHQRAIAVGLVISREEVEDCLGVVVMDGDGEDRPQD